MVGCSIMVHRPIRFKTVRLVISNMKHRTITSILRLWTVVRSFQMEFDDVVIRDPRRDQDGQGPLVGDQTYVACTCMVISPHGFAETCRIIATFCGAVSSGGFNWIPTSIFSVACTKGGICSEFCSYCLLVVCVVITSPCIKYMIFLQVYKTHTHTLHRHIRYTYDMHTVYIDYYTIPPWIAIAFDTKTFSMIHWKTWLPLESHSILSFCFCFKGSKNHLCQNGNVRSNPDDPELM